MIKKAILADSPEFPIHKGVQKGSPKGLNVLVLCLKRVPRSNTWGCQCPSAVTDLQKGLVSLAFQRPEPYFGKLLEKQRGFLLKAFIFWRVYIKGKKKKFNVRPSAEEYLLVRNAIGPISFWSVKNLQS